MKKILLAGIAAAAFCGAPAFAADMPTKGPVYAPAPVFNWTGFYAGLDAGYYRDNGKMTIGALSAKSDTDGFIGGGHVGYRWQSTSPLVLGIEADLFGLAKGLRTDDEFIPGTTAHVSSHRNISALAQVGYAIDRSLLYITGGASWADEHGCRMDPGVIVGCVSGTDLSKTKAGWSLGAGYEYAFAPNWTSRIQYLHSDFGSFGAATPGSNPPFTTLKFRTDEVLLGISYKFGDPGWGKSPVVAKY